MKVEKNHWISYTQLLNTIKRNAVRAIIVNDQHEVLLMRIRNRSSGLDFWICPGGGLNENEELIPGLRRELKEELGLLDFTIGCEVHRRQHTYNCENKSINQHEVFFFVRINKFEPVMSDPIEAMALQEFFWWPLDQLKNATATVAPEGLELIVRKNLT